MGTQFSASATSAGAVISTTLFEVPQFQREYAWTEDEYAAFWNDLQRSLDEDSYFLGLVILTANSAPKNQVVDGQQKLITVTLLAVALYREAVANGRTALADRIRADFIDTIDYQTDEVTPKSHSPIRQITPHSERFFRAMKASLRLRAWTTTSSHLGWSKPSNSWPKGSTTT